MSEQHVKSLPLQGKRILVTRTREQAGVLSERLRSLGAFPVEFPTIRIAPPRDWGPLDAALRKLCQPDPPGRPHYAWLVFTSANGVYCCFERLRSLGYSEQALDLVRVAAIGPATAAALVRYGVKADLVPAAYIAEDVAAALIEDTRRYGESLEGMRVLLARAAEARRVLVTDLQRAGMLVDEVAAYQTLAATHDDEQGREVLRLLQANQLDVVTFTSSSTVRNFVQWLANCELPVTGAAAHALLNNGQVVVACIGPITSRTAGELGLDVRIEAREFTIDGLVEAILEYYEGYHGRSDNNHPA